MPVPTRHGFSLIELLVVVAIIAVLAGMLLPAVGLVKASVESTRCAGNVRQLLLGMATYRTDNDGLMPSMADSIAYKNWGSDPSNHRWQHKLDVYLEDYRIFNCPVSMRKEPGFAVINLPSSVRGTASGYLGICLYAYNQEGWGRCPDAGSPNGPMLERTVDGQLAAAGLPGASARCPVVMDGVWAFDGYPANDSWPNLAGNGWGCFFPHRGDRQNTGFIDGHVESHALADLRFGSGLVALP